MDKKQRRSPLKNLLSNKKSTDIKPHATRRISFSGKTSVRVFHEEEEPKTWNNSYEFSDHLNENEIASNTCASSTATTQLQKIEYNGNISQSIFKHKKCQIQTNDQKNITNLSSSNSFPVINLTKDMINVSYQNQNSKLQQIENSMDITLCEKEKKFQVEGNKSNDQSNNSYSFSLEDYEKEPVLCTPGERTVDFLLESRNNPSVQLCVLNNDDISVKKSQYNNGTAEEPIMACFKKNMALSSHGQLFSGVLSNTHLSHNPVSSNIVKRDLTQLSKMDVVNDTIEKEADHIVYSSMPISKTLNFDEDMLLDESIMNEGKSPTGALSKDIEIENDDPDINNYSDKSRKTLFFNNDMSIEDESFAIDQKDIAKDFEDVVENNFNSRKTLNFCNDEMLTENVSLSVNQKNNSAEKYTEKNITEENKVVEYNYHSRKTLHFSNETLSIEDVSSAVDKGNNAAEKYNGTKNIEVERDLVEKNYQSRKTLYFSNDKLSIENVPLEIDQRNNSAEKYTEKKNIEVEDVVENNYNSRKTLYFSNEKLSIESVPLEIDQRNNSAEKYTEKKNIEVEDVVEHNYNSRKTLYFSNEELSAEKYTEKKNIEVEKDVVENNYNSRKTLFFNNDELSTENISLAIDRNNSTEKYADPKNIEVESDDVEQEKYIKCKKFPLLQNSNTNKRKTLFFEDNNDIPLDQSVVPTAKQDNLFKTPIKIYDSFTNYPVTPRLSLLEFLAFEKYTEKDNMENDKCVSPLQTESLKKRPPINITPAFSIPKRRPPLTSITENNTGETHTPKPMVRDFEQSMEVEELGHTNNCVANSNTIKLSEITPKQSVLESNPQTERKSHIPILINSGKKSKKVASNDAHSDNFKATHFEMDIEGDDLDNASIQLMRKATTFIQSEELRRATTFIQSEDYPIRQIELDTAHKPVIFEGNPITISDVSVFFDSHRKSHLQRCSALQNSDSVVYNTPEKSKIDFRHLTMDDIDKTRLSLVNITYEDCAASLSCLEQPPPREAAPSGNMEHIIDLTNRRQNFNESVCRKCKRCQRTFIDESIDESFKLPELPPLPDIGLDRLRRLKKLPTIEDVHRLYQADILSNTFNISDEDSRISCDLNDDKQEKTSDLTNFIQKYEEDMKSFELEIQRKYQKKSAKLSAILKLDATLKSDSSNNWIFDYQAQYQGILVFTHKKMYAFTLSLTFEEIDPFGYDIKIKTARLGKGHLSKKDWKPIDFVLDYQLKLRLPYILKRFCNCNNEDIILKTLKEVDNECLNILQMGNYLQRICISNQSYIKKDECRTYVQKTIRQIVADCDNIKSVKKTYIKIEILNLETLSFKDIFYPRLHNFFEEIHLLPTGLQFLQEFLPNALKYLKTH